MDLPLSLDPREPPSTPSPHKARSPRRTTPRSSRTTSPHPIGFQSSALHRSTSPASRDEEEGGNIFERDIERIGDTSPTEPVHLSPSQHHHHHTHTHHHIPTARTSATDQLFPTVLDDAISALSSPDGQDVLVVTPSRSPSRSGSPGGKDRFRRVLGVEPGGSGSHSPVLSLAEGGRELWDASAHHGALLGAGLNEVRLSLSSPFFNLLSQTDREFFFLAGDQKLFTLATPSPPTTSSTFISSYSHPSQSHRLSFISPQDLRASSPLTTHSLSVLTSGSGILPLPSSPSAASSPPPPAAAATSPLEETDELKVKAGLEDRFEKLDVAGSGNLL